MDLDFSSEQEMLRDMVRGVCQSYSPLTTVRELEDDAVGYPVELWKQLAELDLIGLMLPAQYGGSEMTMLEGALVYGEFGRSLAPTPPKICCAMAVTSRKVLPANSFAIGARRATSRSFARAQAAS